ncbi:MAG: DUF748 domain-containing protein [Defluviicoccus sp.]
MSQRSFYIRGGDQRGKARGRRRWIGIGAPVVLILSALFLGVHFGPQLLARHLVGNYFRGLNIDTSGVDTLTIDPWAGRVAVGPVAFRGTGPEADADAAQIGRLGLSVDYTALFRKRALLAAVIVEGIRLDVQQTADGELSFNGIPLRQILAEQAPADAIDEAKEAAAEVEQAETAWGVGIDDLELRDSRLVFTDHKGGRATIDVAQLDLEGFRTWRADVPGSFRLQGSLNGMGIAAEGTATPLSSNIRIDSRVDVSGITISRIEAYTGPLGFSSSDGTLDLSLTSKGAAVFPDARVDAALDARIAIRGLDAARADIGAFKLAGGSIALPALAFTYDGTGSIGLTGTADAALDGLDIRVAQGTRVAAASLRADVQDLRVALPTTGAVTLTARPTLALEGVELGGPDIEGTIATTKIALTAFAFDPARLAMVVTGTMAVNALDLVVPLRKPIRIAIASFNGTADGTEFGFGDRTLLRGPIAAVADGVAVTVAMKVPTPPQPPPALHITSAHLSAELPRFVYEEQAEGDHINLGGPMAAFDGFVMTTPVAPGFALDVRADRLNVKDPALELNESAPDGATLSLVARADVSAPDFSVAYRQDAAPADAPAALGARLRMFAFGMRELTCAENGPALTVKLAGPLTADRLDVALAATPDQAEAAAMVTKLDLDLTDVGYHEEPVAIDWHAKLDLAMRALELSLDKGRRASARVSDVKLDALDANAKPQIAFERLRLGKLDASLIRPKAAAPAPAEAKKSARRPEKPSARDAKNAARWPPGGLPAIRIGQLAILDGAKLTVADEAVQPARKSTLEIQKFALVDLDSIQPQRVSDLRLDARLDGAPITVDGWGTIFKPKPDFGLTARVDGLRLASVSPYVGPEIGLDLVGGTIDVDARAGAQTARLEGEVKATIRDAAFADRPGAGEDAISRSIGLPLNAIVDLLEDADGTIDVVIPFEGDLASPDFDLSQVMWTGFVRVLRALVTAPFKLVSTSVSLLSASEQAGGADQSGGKAAFTLEPIPFPAGSATLDAGARPRIKSLVQVLKDRPRLRLKVCGIAAQADLGPTPTPQAPTPQELTPEQTAALARLAARRMDAVARELTAGGGIAGERIQRCPAPVVDPSDTGGPRVAVRF